MFEFFKKAKEAKGKFDKLVDFIETAGDINDAVKVMKVISKVIDDSNSSMLQKNKTEATVEINKSIATEEAKGIAKHANMTKEELTKEFESYVLDLSDSYWVSNYEEYAKWYLEMTKRKKQRVLSLSQGHLLDKEHLPKEHKLRAEPQQNYWDLLDEKLKNEILSESKGTTKRAEQSE